MSIVTDRLTIVPFGEEHLTERYVAWLNDPEVVRYSEQRHTHHTLKSCRAYWRSFQDTSNFFWALVTRDLPGRQAGSLPGYIGTMTAYRDEANSVADVGILIGERSAWGQGYGFEAWQAICQWLLTIARVRKITAGTVSENKAMLAIMEKAGMVPDGSRKSHTLINEKPVDVVHMALFNKMTTPK